MFVFPEGLLRRGGRGQGTMIEFPDVMTCLVTEHSARENIIMIIFFNDVTYNMCIYDLLNVLYI